MVEGVGASSPDNRFSTLVSRALGWEELNLGVAGTTMTGRDDKGLIVEGESGIGRVPDILHAAPNWVIILYGGNDFALSKPIGDPEQFRQGTFYWDFDTLLRGLIENLPDTQILLMTSLFRPDADLPNALGLTLNDYNGAIRHLAQRYSLRLADTWLHTSIGSHNFAALSSDGIHLNDEGQQRLAAFLIECLSSDRCE